MSLWHVGLKKKVISLQSCSAAVIQSWRVVLFRNVDCWLLTGEEMDFMNAALQRGEPEPEPESLLSADFTQSFTRI